MLTVHGFAPLPHVASPSPFCLKLETWLRLAGVPYATAAYSPFQAPRGKAPYVKLDDGSWLADSDAIIHHLTTTLDRDLDADLTPEQRATSVAIQRILEDHLYPILLRFRWIDDGGFAVLKGAYFGAMPVPARWVVPGLARRNVVALGKLHGVARYPRAELAVAATRDLDALAWFLGDKPWFLGDRPHVVDAIAFGFLANVHLGPFDDEMVRALRGHANLVDWIERVQRELWREPRP